MREQRVHKRHSQISEHFEPVIEKLIDRRPGVPSYYYLPNPQMREDFDFESRLLKDKLNFPKNPRYESKTKTLLRPKGNSVLIQSYKPVSVQKSTQTKTMTKTDALTAIPERVVFERLNDNPYASIYQCLKIVNTDTVLRRIRINPITSEHFTLENIRYPLSGSSEVAPGNCIEIDIRFTPCQDLFDTVTEVLTISSEKTSIDIPLVIEKPDFLIRGPEVIDYKETWTGSRIQGGFKIQNCGFPISIQATLKSLNLSPNEKSPFEMTDQSIYLDHLQTTDIYIEFMPITNKAYNATLELSTALGKMEIPVVGLGSHFSLSPVALDGVEIPRRLIKDFKCLSFLDCFPGKQMKRSLILKSVCNDIVPFRFYCPDERFTVTPEEGQFEGPNPIELEVTFLGDADMYEDIKADLFIELPTIPTSAISSGMIKNSENLPGFQIQAKLVQTTFEISDVITYTKPLYINVQNQVEIPFTFHGITKGILEAQMFEGDSDLKCGFGLMTTKKRSIQFNPKNESNFCEGNWELSSKLSSCTVNFEVQSESLGKKEVSCIFDFQGLTKVVKIFLKFIQTEIQIYPELHHLGYVSVNRPVSSKLMLKNDSEIKSRVFLVPDKYLFENSDESRNVFLMPEEEATDFIRTLTSLAKESPLLMAPILIELMPQSEQQITLELIGYEPQSYREVIKVYVENVPEVQEIVLESEFQEPVLVFNQAEFKFDDLFVNKEYTIKNSSHPKILLITNPTKVPIRWNFVERQRDEEMPSVEFWPLNGVIQPGASQKIMSRITCSSKGSFELDFGIEYHGNINADNVESKVIKVESIKYVFEHVRGPPIEIQSVKESFIDSLKTSQEFSVLKQERENQSHYENISYGHTNEVTESECVNLESKPSRLAFSQKACSVTSHEIILKNTGEDILPFQISLTDIELMDLADETDVMNNKNSGLNRSKITKADNSLTKMTAPTLLANMSSSMTHSNALINKSTIRKSLISNLEAHTAKSSQPTLPFKSTMGAHISKMSALKAIFQKVISSSPARESVKLVAAMSKASGTIQPNSTLKVQIYFYGEEAMTINETLLVTSNGQQACDLPIFGKFTGLPFELVDNQIYLRNFSDEYRELTFGRDKSQSIGGQITRIVRIKNLSSKPIKLYLGIYNHIEEYMACMGKAKYSSSSSSAKLDVHKYAFNLKVQVNELTNQAELVWTPKLLEKKETPFTISASSFLIDAGQETNFSVTYSDGQEMTDQMIEGVLIVSCQPISIKSEQFLMVKLLSRSRQGSAKPRLFD